MNFQNASSNQFIVFVADTLCIFANYWQVFVFCLNFWFFYFVSLYLIIQKYYWAPYGAFNDNSYCLGSIAYAFFDYEVNILIKLVLTFLI